MKRVFGYELGPFSVCYVPENAKVLSVELVNGVPKVYFLIDTTTDEKEPRKIFAANTGTEIPYEIKSFIGTFQDDGIVWHVFEIN